MAHYEIPAAVGQPTHARSIGPGRVVYLFVGTFVLIVVLATAAILVTREEPTPAGSGTTLAEDAWMPAFTSNRAAQRLAAAQAISDPWAGALASTANAQRLEAAQGITDGWEAALLSADGE